MSDPVAAVACSVEIYPFEGGPYFITGGQIKSVTVTKTLRGGSDGRFSVELAPGGPFGTESVPDWPQILTPGSHVLIGMSRGGDAAIVMDGVVTVSGEDQVWQTTDEGSTAARSPAITGSDFTWFFNSQNWYSLAMYGLVAGTGIGNQLGYVPSSLVEIMQKGVTNGTPVSIGQTWFDQIMTGPSGMLSSTFVPYQGGDTRLPFNSLFGKVMEQYPGVFIPYTEQFLGLESWMAKFMDIFPWPWYEFFVTTAPQGAYPLVAPPAGSATTSTSGADFTITAGSFGPANVVASGTTFRMRDFPTALSAGPLLVARVNPVPKFDFVKLNSTELFVPSFAMDTARWNALPLAELSGYGFFGSHVEFSSDEARNFYLLNPTAYATLFGNNNSNVTPFSFVFTAAADPASVHRYGYRPADGTLRWFYDWEGRAAQQQLTEQESAQGIDIYQSVATLTAALASWWHPLPLMLRGSVSIPLSPKIYIGTRFRYAPFKDGTIWEFYVEGVSHRFVFDGMSSTTLTLTRGLPASVYADSGQGGLLRAIYTGNARREFIAGKPGIYQAGLPGGTGQGLQVFSTPRNAADLAQQMSEAYVTPQWPSR